MSIYKVPDPEDLIECPYDDTHMVRAKRFPYHLIKCRKNYLDLDYATCPFNARHEMPRPELRYHMANCPDRALLYRDIVHSQTKNDDSSFKGYTGVPKYKSDWDQYESGENWDDEAPVTEAIMFYGKKKDLRRNMAQPAASSEPQLRLPRETAQVLQAALSEKQAQMPNPAPAVSKQQPSSVFAYSAVQAMPGIGRGRAAVKMSSAEPPASVAPVLTPNRSRPGLGRGRAAPKPTGSPTPGGASKTSQAEAGTQANAKSAAPKRSSRIAANIYGNLQQDGTSTAPERLTESLTALSKGRGMAKKIQVPTVGGMSSGLSTAGSSLAGSPPRPGQYTADGSADSLSGSPARAGLDPEEARRREVRKWQKKLREIELLEEKKRTGGVLNQDEEYKISRKDSVLAALEKCSN